MVDGSESDDAAAQEEEDFLEELYEPSPRDRSGGADGDDILSAMGVESTTERKPVMPKLSIKLGGTPDETPAEEPVAQDAEQKDEAGKQESAAAEPAAADSASTPSAGQHREGEPKPKFKAFVANLSFGTTWAELKEHFADAEGVLHVDVLKKKDGKSRGCGIVTFDTKEHAEEGMRRNSV